MMVMLFKYIYHNNNNHDHTMYINMHVLFIYICMKKGRGEYSFNSSIPINHLLHVNLLQAPFFKCFKYGRHFIVFSHYVRLHVMALHYITCTPYRNKVTPSNSHRTECLHIEMENQVSI